MILLLLTTHKIGISYYYFPRADDKTGFDNGIIVAYGMCPPITLQEFYERDPDLPCPSHFMRGTADEIWGEDMHGVMRTTAENWTDDREEPTYK
jgi:hypothetical protein